MGFFFFLILYIERNIDQLPPVHTLTRDQTRNLGMCPDRELDPEPFGVWDEAPTAEPPGQGLLC